MRPGLRDGAMIMFVAHRAGIRHVVRPLGRLGVKDPVRVDADWKPGVVAEYDGDRVADLGVDDRPQDSVTLLRCAPGFQRCEGIIGVFAVGGLQVFPADPVLRLAEISRLLLGEGLSGDRVVRVGGSEIPDYLVSGDKINPLGGAGRSRRESEKGNENNRSNLLPF